MLHNPQLFCPVRGPLQAKLKAKDGLTFTEEKRRIDCIAFLIQRGYPKEHIEAETVIVRMGSSGQNSLRADIVVYDVPAATLKGNALGDNRSHMMIIAEIKRDSGERDSAIEKQLKPALALVPKTDVIGIYWDDVDQDIFVKEVEGSTLQIKEAAIATLPTYGTDWKIADISYSDLEPASDLVRKFEKLDDVLHQAGISNDDRYNILFQILLVKIFDEQNAKPKNGVLYLQDFSLRSITDDDVKKKIEEALGAALKVYGPLLPKRPSLKINCSGSALRSVSHLLCSVDILGSSPQVIQDFFMYFGRFIYKVDLAQYFTPYEVIELIAKIVNPKFGDVVKDPACGTADFLVGAKRVAEQRHGADISAQLNGVDTAPLAVNLSVFNMILNGDGRSNITVGDSLKDIGKYESAFTVALCNPPFGTRIVERRKEVLKQFDLGLEEVGGAVLASQETGLLFVEVCLKSVSVGGRVGIILPNGYLGNRSERYVRFRRWLLRHARIAAVIGFPRFTFKRSGADVSASVVILQKRDAVLSSTTEIDDHPVHFNLVDKVGWDLQSKRSNRVYRRNALDGSPVIDPETNSPSLDADFSRVLNELYDSTVVKAFPWMVEGIADLGTGAGWVVPIKDVVARADFSLDPKRWSQKHSDLVKAIKASPHITLSDVLRPVSRKVKAVPSNNYRYVEIEKIYENFGTYIAEELRGWALPGRARLLAAAGDVFIANIWSSAGKWMIAGDDAKDDHLVVTSGCEHFEIIPDKAEMIPDLVFGLSSEAFRVQMRAQATGSDGLSAVAPGDILSIVLPKLTNDALRAELSSRVAAAKIGHLVLPKLVRDELAASDPAVNIDKRSSHVAQV